MPIAMYAIGPEKYDFSSLCAIARMLRIDRFSRGFRRRVRTLFGRQREEDFLEAQAHRAQLEQPPPAVDDAARELAAHVLPVLALDLVADGRAAPVRLDDARDAGHAFQRRARVGA